jgi:hypothetical protein
MSKSNFSIEDEAWAQQLEREYEEYMWSCESAVDGEEPDDFQTLSGQPFCGCNTCYTREQLFFLTPRILDAYKNGQITLAE